jgi:hypothetical protein
MSLTVGPAASPDIRFSPLSYCGMPDKIAAMLEGKTTDSNGLVMVVYVHEDFLTTVKGVTGFGHGETIEDAQEAAEADLLANLRALDMTTLSEKARAGCVAALVHLAGQG